MLRRDLRIWRPDVLSWLAGEKRQEECGNVGRDFYVDVNTEGSLRGWLVAVHDVSHKSQPQPIDDTIIGLL